MTAFSADWLTVELSSGTVPPGGSIDIPVHFDATDLIGGMYSGALRLSDDQRYYCCCWGGSKTRATIPGGCEGIPNKLGR